MTSEEALDELKASTEWTWKDSENYDIVKNDLEVLEIIKNHFPMHIYDEDGHGCVLCVESPELKCAYAELDGYEKDVIKRWLEEK